MNDLFRLKRDACLGDHVCVRPVVYAARWAWRRLKDREFVENLNATTSEFVYGLPSYVYRPVIRCGGKI
eukprot:scaffold168960_cov35-Tisochrysis_lutea.AAC.2